MNKMPYEFTISCPEHAEPEEIATILYRVATGENIIPQTLRLETGVLKYVVAGDYRTNGSNRETNQLFFRVYFNHAKLGPNQFWIRGIMAVDKERFESACSEAKAILESKEDFERAIKDIREALGFHH